MQSKATHGLLGKITKAEAALALQSLRGIRVRQISR
jgi:hypothetical protein